MLIGILWGVSASVTFAQQPMKELIRSTINSIYGSGDITIIDTNFAPTFIRHPSEGDVNSLKISVLSLRAAVPDLKLTHEIMITENNWVAARLRLSGTFTGEFVSPDALPVAPNNESIDFAVQLVYRLDETGKIAEEWGGFDNLSFLGQLGVIPAPVTSPVAPMQYPDVVDVGMSVQNRQIIQQYFEAVNSGNLAFIDTAFKSDFAAHNPFGTLDREGMVNDFERLRGALPDLKVNVNQLVTEGNWTVALYTLNGTFTSNYLNANGSSVPPTGKRLSLASIAFYRFEQQGLVAESFELYDSLSFLTQLGLITVAVPVPAVSPSN